MNNNGEEVRSLLGEPAPTQTSAEDGTRHEARSIPTNIDFPALIGQNGPGLVQQAHFRPEEPSAASREVLELIESLWEADEIRGDELLESYQECVRRSLVDNLTSRQQRMLRNYPYENGAPIRKGTGISILRAVTEVLP